MSWIKIDDRFLTNPKILSAGLEARSLYVSSIVYSAGELTDGMIPRATVSKLAALSDVNDAKAATQRLLDLNLWELASDTDGYVIHDYHDYNPTAREAKERKQAVSQKRSEAGSKGAANRWQNHGKSDDDNMAPRADSSPIAPSPSPNPSRSEEKTPPTEGDAPTANVPVIALPNKAKQKTFQLPKEEECNDYFVLKGKPDLSERFWNYWESVGWKRAGKPMVNWQAAARQWIAEEKAKGSGSTRADSPSNVSPSRNGLSPEQRAARNLAALTGDLS